MMTPEQQATVNRIRERGYTVWVGRHVGKDVLLLTATRGRRKPVLGLRLYPTGEYETARHEPKMSIYRRKRAWQS